MNGMLTVYFSSLTKQMNTLEINDRLVGMVRECVEKHLNFGFIDYTVRERFKELKEHPELIPDHDPLTLDGKKVIDIMELIREETEKLVDGFAYKYIHSGEEPYIDEHAMGKMSQSSDESSYEERCIDLESYIDHEPIID